jgi:hypothetical protein
MKTIITAIIVAAVISGSAGATSLLIDGSKLKNHSVPVTKLTASAVRSLQGHRGPQGAQGVQGPPGAQGAQGAQGIQGAQGVAGSPGLSGYVSGAGSSVSVAAGAQGFAGAWCPAGTQPLGGGYFPLAGSSALRTVSATFAINDVTGAPGFLVSMANEGGTAESFHVVVRCANVS